MKKIKQNQGSPEKWWKWDETEQNTNQKKQSKKEEQTEEEEDSGREMNTDRVHVFHHAICEALINVSLSLQRRLLAETLRLVSSPSSSSLLLLSPSWIPLFLLRWHNPSSCGAMSGRPQVTLRNSVRETEVKCEILIARAFVCLCVLTAFNAMLIQFIFNEGTVSAYREAKQISGLLHSGKSIAQLFILLFELCV